MELSQLNGVQADSVALQPAPQSSVVISRTALDFGGADAFRVDSSRLEPKKNYVPVVKTVPYVPANDTIDHPAYDVLTGEFVIAPHDGSMPSQLRINPIAPIDSNSQPVAIEATTPVFAPAQPIAESPQKTVLVQQPDEPQAADTTNVLAAADADTSIVLIADADTATIAIADTSALATTDTTNIDSLSVRPAQTVFAEKDGKPINRKPGRIVVNDAGETDWMVGIIILSCVLFAWTRMIYGKYISMLMQSAVNFFTARRVYEVYRQEC